MTRTIARRLELLETRAKEVAMAYPSHTLCFVDTNRRVVSQYEMATSKWTHFDPDDRQLFQRER